MKWLNQKWNETLGIKTRSGVLTIILLWCHVPFLTRCEFCFGVALLSVEQSEMMKGVEVRGFRWAKLRRSAGETTILDTSEGFEKLILLCLVDDYEVLMARCVSRWVILALARSLLLSIAIFDWLSCFKCRELKNCVGICGLVNLPPFRSIIPSSLYSTAPFLGRISCSWDPLSAPNSYSYFE